MAYYCPILYELYVLYQLDSINDGRFFGSVKKSAVCKETDVGEELVCCLLELDRNTMILCLGMSYPSINETIKRSSRGGKDWSKICGCHIEEGRQIELIVRLVRLGILTQMDGRDLVRCLAMEEVCPVAIFCVSQERAAVYDKHHHLEADFNSRRFVKELERWLSGRTFDQVILDYFWTPPGWNESHWRQSFFDEILVLFAQRGLLESVPKHPEYITGRFRRGVVYLPFCLHCLKEVVAAYGKLSVFYNVKFLHRDNLDEIPLWVGTQSLDEDLMCSVFGKQLQQEEIYCCVTEQQIRLMEDGFRVTKTALLSFVERRGGCLVYGLLSLKFGLDNVSLCPL